MKGNGTVTGDSPVTAAAQTVAAQGRKRRRQDTESLVGWPGWPRLLTLRLAALYLSMGVRGVRDLLDSGVLTTTVIERPRTPEAMKPRARTRGGPKTAPISRELRMIRLDRAVLDRFVDDCEQRRLAPEWNT